ncbi:hypothetical protein R1flu_010631 [Riccia fluitans]|uniref:Uncharacterized protein n=1 Tax=Riccia fluitans TaxID=41844 RepID=A0ABD1Z6K5_9MARC
MVMVAMRGISASWTYLGKLPERQNLNPSCECIDERNVRRLVDCVTSQTLQRNSNIIALPGDKLLKRQFAWPTAFLVTAHFDGDLSRSQNIQETFTNIEACRRVLLFLPKLG